MMDAIIDIGSNSVRLCLMREREVNPKIINTTFLADGLAATGFLKEDAIRRTAQAVTDFVAEAKSEGAENIYIFGTEAMRSGKNANILISAVYEKTGLGIDVIDGFTEALCGFLGAKGLKEKLCVVDIGGASIELTQGAEDIEKGVSLPLGVKRVKDLTTSRESIREYYAKKVRDFPRFTYPLVGIGGTATSLSAMLRRMPVYDANENHGSIVKLDDLLALEDEIFALDSPENIHRAYPCIDVKRASVIGVGCVALIEIMRYLNKTELTVSEHDNIEGYYLLKKDK
jgi:exopolyphosphatase/guanosine-5'-triphosphate,3'-diphosphate pyrophosphatase